MLWPLAFLIVKTAISSFFIVSGADNKRRGEKQGNGGYFAEHRKVGTRFRAAIRIIVRVILLRAGFFVGIAHILLSPIAPRVPLRAAFSISISAAGFLAYSLDNSAIDNLLMKFSDAEECLTSHYSGKF